MSLDQSVRDRITRECGPTLAAKIISCMENHAQYVGETLRERVKNCLSKTMTAEEYSNNKDQIIGILSWWITLG